MQGNILSYVLTGYAIYSAIRNKNTLAEQIDRIVDIEKSQEGLSSEVEKLTTTTYSLLDKNLRINYTLILGRPTSMSKLSGSLHYTIHNDSAENTYLLKALMFQPIIGTTFCNTSAQKLLALQLGTGARITPGGQVSGRVGFNNLGLGSTVVRSVSDALLEKFHKSEGWDKLGDRYATIQGGCEADVWLLANAPYVDSAHDYIVSRREVKGALMWHGGNYLPGNSTVKDGFGAPLKFNDAKEMFRI